MSINEVPAELPEAELDRPSGSPDGSTRETIRSLVVDPAQLVRESIGLLLGANPTFEVVATAADHTEARRYANGHKPDLAIVGPFVGCNGAPVTQADIINEVRTVSPLSKVVMLARADASPRELSAALEAGVDGVLSVDVPVKGFVEALKGVADGGAHVPAGLAMDLLKESRERDDLGITPRETEVLRLIALGHTNSEIADGLCLSVRTIETHRANIQSKLGVVTRSGLVRWALDHGLIS